jgi:hypothetical protein
MTTACLYSLVPFFFSRQLYWNWSWDDLVVYDLPAMVDYVCSQTRQKPHYVGHSMVRSNAC